MNPQTSHLNALKALNLQMCQEPATNECGEMTSLFMMEAPIYTPSPVPYPTDVPHPTAATLSLHTGATLFQKADVRWAPEADQRVPPTGTREALLAAPARVSSKQ